MIAATTANSCALKPVLPASKKVISVNGVVIAREAIAAETQFHPASKPVEAIEAAARALVVRELLLQDASNRGLVAEPLRDPQGRLETDEEALVRQAIETVVADEEPAEEACRKYHASNAALFCSPSLYEASHILIPADPRDKEARLQAREVATAILVRIKAAPGSFAAQAREHSACSSAATGGNLGQIGPDQTVPEFEAGLARMAGEGASTGLIESRYGLHVVRLDHHEPGQPLPFEYVREQIADRLRQRASVAAAQRHISRLAGDAVITGISMISSAKSQEKL